MTKEEVKQEFFDKISNLLSDADTTAKEVKDLAKAYKTVCDTEYDNDLLAQLASMPEQQCKHNCQSCNKHDAEDGDDGVFGFCD